MDSVQFASDVLRNALQMTFMMALPLLLTGLAVGITVSVLQAATQVQEQTLSFIPKILAMMAALYFLMPVLIRTMVEYCRSTFLGIKTIPF